MLPDIDQPDSGEPDTEEIKRSLKLLLSNLSPRKLSYRGNSNSNGRVKMPSWHSSTHQYAKDHSDSPANKKTSWLYFFKNFSDYWPPVDGKEVSLLSQGENWLSNWASTKHNKNKSSCKNQIIILAQPGKNIQVLPRNSARNSLVAGLVILKLQHDLFLPIFIFLFFSYFLNLLKP